jgi:hypothetical protein
MQNTDQCSIHLYYKPNMLLLLAMPLKYVAYHVHDFHKEAVP